jgi:DDE superfamily endonuclease
MNPPRATDRDYIDFLIGTPREASACEAARVQPPDPAAPAHDAFTRLLARLEPDPEALWQEVRPHVRRGDSILVVDDTVLDKPYAHKMGLVGPFWSGKHQRVLRGINLVTLAWTDGDAVYPTDYRLVDPAEAPRRNKNEHFREMLVTAQARGFRPRYVCFDAWYSGKDNLKAVRSHGWHFLTQVRSNRRVDLDRTGNQPIAAQPIAATGTVVHVEGFGLVKAFRIVAPNGDTEHWITNDLGLDDLGRVTYAERAWAIEEYHRGLKQCTEVERCPARLARSQRNHIGLALRAFVRLEWHRYHTGISWFEAKWGIIRDAVRAYLTDPVYNLPEQATA